MEKKKVIAILAIWSFVHFILYMFGGGGHGIYHVHEEREIIYPFQCFELADYDITELTIYVGGAWLAFFLYYYLKDDNKA